MPDLNIVVGEDDHYSCDMMASLLARDRRTRVAASGSDTLYPGLWNKEARDADLFLLDSEFLDQRDLPLTIMGDLRRQLNTIKIVCTGTDARADVLRSILAVGGNGYLIKGEIHFALAEALLQAAKGIWVCTPCVVELAEQEGIKIPKRRLVLNGSQILDQLEGQDQEIARLALLFDQPYTDIADEMRVSRGHVADLVSDLYDTLGLSAVLDGDVAPETYFDNEEILGLFHTLIKSRQKRPRARKGMKTLAFHMLTLAEIVEEG